MKRAFHEAGGSVAQSPIASNGSQSPTATVTGPPPKIPKISRKVTACTECQTRKIRCNVGHENPTCSRCQRMGLRCVVNKSLQSLLEDESEWKSTMEQKTDNLQAAVSEILQTLKLPKLEAFNAGAPRTSVPAMSPINTAAELGSRHNVSQPQIGPPQNEPSIRPTRTLGMAMTRENSQEPSGSEDLGTGNLVAAPMGSLYEVTKLRNLRSNPRGYIHPPERTLLEEDFISRGKMTEGEAKELFVIFSQSLNHYLWGGIALVHEGLNAVRNSSTLLLTAILAVTALHVPGKTKTFDICYSEFLTLVCDSMLDRYHNLDTVRGLCIGAFWLSDVSWKLSGHAVRIATELNLHQSYSKAMRGLPEHVERARVWYLLYVCDHHFSIAYGRPPVIHEDSAIAGHKSFLQLPGIVQADLRLHSQVAIFIILTRIYNTFGPDTEQSLAEDKLSLLLQFNADLESWRATWATQLSPNPFVSSYPSKGVTLHYLFGRLQLNSLSLRGYQQLYSNKLSQRRQEFATIAIESAIAILQFVLDEPDIRNSLVGVPLYLHTMISYAAVFLLKIQLKWKAGQLGINSSHIADLVARVIKLLNEARAGERHLTYHIAAGLSKMLDRFREWQGRESAFFEKGGKIESVAQANGRPYPSGDLLGFGVGGEFGGLGYEMYPELAGMYEQQWGFFDVLSSQMPG